MQLFGIDLLKAFNSLRGLPSYVGDLYKFRHQQKTSNISFPFGKLYPNFEDRFLPSGIATGQYFHQDLLIEK